MTIEETVKTLKAGDTVRLSWKEDEGSGWYSNKRKKTGVVRFDEGGFYVETAINPRVRESDLTSIAKILPPPTEGTASPADKQLVE
jgi:hypothetical protein